MDKEKIEQEKEFKAQLLKLVQSVCSGHFAATMSREAIKTNTAKGYQNYRAGKLKITIQEI